MTTHDSKTRIGAVLATAALGLGVSFAAGAAPASANPDCEEDKIGSLCLWEHAAPGNSNTGLGAGRAMSFKKRAANLHRARFGDMTSQIRNYSRHTYCLYEHVDYKGNVLVVGGGEEHSLAPRKLYSSWNDKISSLRPCD